MWCTREYKHLHVAERVISERIELPEVSDKDKALLARAMVCLIEMKRQLRLDMKTARTLPGIPPKDSLLVESTPDGTTPEGG